MSEVPLYPHSFEITFVACCAGASDHDAEETVGAEVEAVLGIEEAQHCFTGGGETSPAMKLARIEKTQLRTGVSR